MRANVVYERLRACVADVLKSMIRNALQLVRPFFALFGSFFLICFAGGKIYARVVCQADVCDGDIKGYYLWALAYRILNSIYTENNYFNILERYGHAN